MKRYMLDTNTVSFFIKGHPVVVQNVVGVAMASLCISSITEAELQFGLAKRPEAKRLHEVVREFLIRVDVLPWDSDVAKRYGSVRVDMERYGRLLGPLDLLIATHALAVGFVLVTNDRSFSRVIGLEVEDWTTMTVVL